MTSMIVRRVTVQVPEKPTLQMSFSPRKLRGQVLHEHIIPK